MAGGSGERFWPLSTPDRPKQLLKLTSPTETMLEEAVNRISPLVGPENVYVATSADLEHAIRAAKLVPEANIWAEPARRNTLGCLTWLAANLLATGGHDTTVAVLTSDHKIEQPEAFRATVDTALSLAERHAALVTIGIPPTRAETGYGYIEVGPLEAERDGLESRAHASLSFREKPSASIARRFLAEGRFLWNSGMFFFSLATFLAELQGAQPEIRRLVDRMAESLGAGDAAAAEEGFSQLPSISIDFAVMEKAQHVLVVPADFPWDDVGAWDSLDRTLGTDEHGNVRQGAAIVRDTRNSIIVNDSDQVKVGIVGLDNVIVVATDGAVLVCAKDHAQRVREVSH
jgi:mannose-1-phosphate guanylyltransferase